VTSTVVRPGRVCVRWREQRALLGTTASLLATTGITTVLGLAFWWLAAHRAPLSAVGYGSAAVSAMTLTGTFGMAGLNTVLIGHLARRPRDADGLLTDALATSAAVSAVLAAGFWVIAGVLDPRIAPYLPAAPEAALFIGGAAITGAALVLDEAVLGMIGGGPQLWRNTGFAVAKLIALAGLVTLWHDRFGTPILAAWAAGTALSLIPVTIVLHRRGVRLITRPRWVALRQLGRASIANTWLNNALQAPVLAAPILVTGLLTAAEGGAFYVASTVVMVGVMLPYHFTTALYAASTADPSGLAAKVRVTLRICLLGGLVGVPLVILCAHPLLRLFGAQYADRATVPLQLMIGGYFGSVLKNHYIALCRIGGRITQAAVFATVALFARVVGVVAGALAGGLTGVAIALLAVMCAEGLYAVPAVRAAVRGRELAMSVCYYLQTHTRPEQVLRLVELIKDGSPDSVVVISHDASRPALDTTRLAAMPGVYVRYERGGYGDFSHLDRFFAAVDWLDSHGVAYDWLENISGQDYPLRPIAEIERTLASTDLDGFLLYAPVFPELAPGADPGAGRRLCAPFDASMRYQYRHWWAGQPTPAKQRWLRPLMAANLVQSRVRVSLAFSTIGVRRRDTIFTDDFVCYGGWFFCTLSAACVRYARDFTRDNPDLLRYFRTVLAPEEVFLQTVLVNSGKFRFEPDSRRYIDLSASRNNHSKTLGVADLDAMLASGAHWARKFDPEHDRAVLDMLDQRVRSLAADDGDRTGYCLLRDGP